MRTLTFALMAAAATNTAFGNVVIQETNPCMFIRNQKHRINCIAWQAFGKGFSLSDWSNCSEPENVNPCDSDACPRQAGFVDCSDEDNLVGVNIVEENGMVLVSPYYVRQAMMLMSMADVAYFNVMDQGRLRLNTCFSLCNQTLACDFSGSDCAGWCAEDGMCPGEGEETVLPTPLPTPAPTLAPTETVTSSPTATTTAAPTSTPTDPQTASPTASPTILDDDANSTFAPTTGA